jgi:hypothetical protein
MDLGKTAKRVEVREGHLPLVGHVFLVSPESEVRQAPGLFPVVTPVWAAYHDVLGGFQPGDSLLVR